MGNLPPINKIGIIQYEWNFDIDDYLEWLSDNDIEDTRNNYMQYINDNVEFYLDLFDNDTFHHFEYVTTDITTIEDEYGKNCADTILSDCMQKGKGELETFLLVDDIDINNPSEINSAAKMIFTTGDYMKDGRGWILSDGTCIYTWSEHNMCTKIPGVKSTYDFLKLGNIRFLPKSINIGKEPTAEQYMTLRKIIASYDDNFLYLDITDNGSHSATYRNPEIHYVINEIKRYFREGIFRRIKYSQK